MKRILTAAIAIMAVSCSQGDGSLPRGKASAELDNALEQYLSAKDSAQQDIHSIMIVQDGKVREEKWMSEGAPDKPHIMMSCSKTFTSLAVGFAIDEGLFSLDDKIVSFFPEDCPDSLGPYLGDVTVENLLTMSCGHHDDPTSMTFIEGAENIDWAKYFLSYPVVHEPGTYFWYNSLGTYMLSAIVQKTSGQKAVDYLQTRLFDPLSIDAPKWEESPQGICCGGWGLYLKTEDLAKTGLLILQGGKWHGKQVLPEGWAEAMSSKHIDSRPGWTRDEDMVERGIDETNSDWACGYCYQMWRCRHGAFRADGAGGQYIIVIPDKNAVIAMTANVKDMQEELNLIWDYIYPAL